MNHFYKLPVLIICLITLFSCTPEALEDQELPVQLEEPNIYLEEGTGEDVPVDDKKN